MDENNQTPNKNSQENNGQSPQEARANAWRQLSSLLAKHYELHDAIKTPEDYSKWCDNFAETMIFFSNVVSQESYDAIHRLMPDKIYKYFKVNEYSLKNFSNGNVWLSRPSEFNDPHDSSIHQATGLTYNVLKQDLLQFVKKHNLQINSDEQLLFHAIKSHVESTQNQQLYNDFKRLTSFWGNSFEMMDNWSKYLGISCFTEVKPDDDNASLMWAHYADNHSGFCLEYDKEMLFEKDIRLLPVNYVDNNDEKIIAPKHYIFAQTEWKYERAATMKSACWQYEKEWRIVV